MVLTLKTYLMLIT